jgi:hypothetical protein
MYPIKNKKNLNNMKTLTTIIATIIILTTANTATAQTNNVTIKNATVTTTTNWVGNQQVTNKAVAISINNNNEAAAVTVEASFDNVTFANAATVNVNNKKIAYYRVKMIDNFGTVTYSATTIVGLEN